MAKRPTCPACGSTDMILPGFTHFHWSRGRWVESKEAATPADGAPLNCCGCGRTWQVDNLDQPLVLTEDWASTPFDKETLDLTKDSS